MIRILIICKIRLYREGLEKVLEQSSPLCVVGTAKDSVEALKKVDQLKPDVVLLDVSIPDALRTLDTLVRSSHGARVIALGVSDLSEQVIAYAEAGVSGFVFSEDPLDDLVATVQRTHSGRLRCSERIAALLLQRVGSLATTHSTPHGKASLTRRELEIVGLLGEGLSNKEIANRLCIEVATVKNHVHSILEKLGACSRSEAVAKMHDLYWSQLTSSLK